MPRLKLVIAYEGTRYSGWQLQAYRDREQPATIQGELERCIARIAGRRLPVHGAGRTDAGVHAEAQVCHVDVPDGLVTADWVQAVNMQLAHDIRVLRAEWLDASFHARKSARGKRYAYTLWTHRDKAPPRLQAFAWSAPALDWTSMARALPKLVGERDFASFQNGGNRMDNTIRILRKVDIEPGKAAVLACPEEWPVATLIFEGNGFLKQMVRNLVGLLVWVGQGKVAVDDIPAFFDAKKRRALPSPSAPAQGLTLLEVLY